MPSMLLSKVYWRKSVENEFVVLGRLGQAGSGIKGGDDDPPAIDSPRRKTSSPEVGHGQGTRGGKVSGCGAVVGKEGMGTSSWL